MSEAPTFRPLAKGEIEPRLELLRSEGFTPDMDRGTWLGAFIEGTLAGWLRLFREGETWMIEDVFVLPEHRRRGIARELLTRAGEGGAELWLICDDDMIPFYEALGYTLMPKEAFPEPLATLYRAKSEWPDGGDHNHNAMRW